MIDLKDVLTKHQKWLNDEPGGVRAYLSGANLSRAYLSRANLSRAYLSRADLSGANLSGANLSRAYLSRADLSGADLSGANLSGADLSGAYLSRANLSGADLSGADLSRADLSGADLSGANLSGATNVPYIPMTCPDEGAYTAFKKVRGDLIVVLRIPEDARRSSASGRKCRADKAEVIRIEHLDGTVADINEVASRYDCDFMYKVGETVSVPNFEPDRWVECAPGIHHFINRQEAVEYTV